MFTFKINEYSYLKKIEMNDAGELFSLVDSSREHLRKWLPWLDANQSLKDSEEFIKLSLEQDSHNSGFQVGIWYKGKLAGLIGLNGVNWRNKATSIGYWLGQEYEGNGLITNSCKALIEYAFLTLGLNRLEIRAAADNIKSKAVAERLGFKCEGLIRESEWLYDHYVDSVVYGLLAKEFKV